MHTIHKINSKIQINTTSYTVNFQCQHTYWLAIASYAFHNS